MVFLFVATLYLLCVQGHVSTVEIGSMKYRGSVCANPNEAERSAAGIAYMQLKPVNRIKMERVK